VDVRSSQRQVSSVDAVSSFPSSRKNMRVHSDHFSATFVRLSLMCRWFDYDRNQHKNQARNRTKRKLEGEDRS